MPFPPGILEYRVRGWVSLPREWLGGSDGGGEGMVVCTFSH